MDSNPLSQINVVSVPKEEALAQFIKYSDAVKRSNSAQDRIMARVYKAISEGLGVINLIDAIKKAGVDEKTWLPRLAVMRADQEEVFFRRAGTAGFYSFSDRYYISRRNRKAQNARLQFYMPEGTFPELQGRRVPIGYYWTQRAPVPPIPPEARPADAYSKYCILWEVSEWKAIAPPDDPMLLRPVGAGLYVVCAHWDLTEIEKMVLGGLLAGN